MLEYIPMSDTRLGRCLPSLPEGVSLEVRTLTDHYHNMFYGGSKEYGIPSVRKLSRMSLRQRKKFHADGKNTTLGYDLTIEFSRELTAQDAPVDWFDFAHDGTECPYSEHEKNAGNWFMDEIEKHGLFTVMGLPFKDSMKVTFLVSADHDQPEPYYSQMERLLKFLRTLDTCDFIKCWIAQWYDLDHWSVPTDTAYEFARMHKGDIPVQPIPFKSDSTMKGEV